MKPAQPLGSLVLVLAGAVLGHAQTAPYAATVTQAEVEVRSAPGDDPKVYPTSRLRRGDTVQVLKDRGNGWLEIKPPAGSFNWIKTLFVDRIGNSNTYMVVTHDETPVLMLVGSELLNQKPTVQSAVPLKRGSQVIAIGPPLTDQGPEADGSWLPIEPPPTEVRYVRADAVQAVKTNPPPLAPEGGPAPAGFTAGGSSPQAADPAPPAPAPNMGVSAGGSSGDVANPVKTTSNSGQGGSPLAAPAPLPASIAPGSPEAEMWQQAAQAEQAGKRFEAEEFYKQLAHRVCNVNHDLAMKCYNRIEFLRGGQKTTSQSQYQGGGVYANPRGVTGSDARFSPVPTDAYGQPLNCQVSSPGYGSPPPPAGVPNSPVPTLEPQAIGPGLLRVAGRMVDYRRAYVLEDSRTHDVIMYVTPQQGVDLESYANRLVSLYGPMVYRGDLRANYMTAMRVTPLP